MVEFGWDRNAVLVGIANQVTAPGFLAQELISRKGRKVVEPGGQFGSDAIVVSAEFID